MGGLINFTINVYSQVIVAGCYTIYQTSSDTVNIVNHNSDLVRQFIVAYVTMSCSFIREVCLLWKV